MSICPINAGRLNKYRLHESRGHTTTVARRRVVDVGGSSCEGVSSSFHFRSTCRKALLGDRTPSSNSTVASRVRRHEAYFATASLHASLCTNGPMTFAATKNWWWAQGDDEAHYPNSSPTQSSCKPAPPLWVVRSLMGEGIQKQPEVSGHTVY